MKKRCPICGKVCGSERGYQAHYATCKTLPNEQQFRALLDMELTQTETLERLGCSQPTLYKLLKRYEITVDWVARSRWAKDRVKGSKLSERLYEPPTSSCGSCESMCERCDKYEFCQALIAAAAGFVLCERLEDYQTVTLKELSGVMPTTNI